MSEEETIARLKKLNEPTFICHHLLENPDQNLNFQCDIEYDNEVWCDACEKILMEEGGWTDRAMKFVDMKPYCRYCFAELKQKYMEKRQRLHPCNPNSSILKSSC